MFSILNTGALVRLPHELQHFQVDDEKSENLPDDIASHVACNSRGNGWVISLLIGLFIDGLAHG